MKTHIAYMDGPNRYYTKRNKSYRKRQILQDFTCTWNLENKTNEKTKTKQKLLINTDGKLMVPEGWEVLGWKK